MSARDKYHEQLRAALIKDNWVITHDPYVIETPGFNYSVDLGAEKIIGAQKGNEKVAIEIKSFLRESIVSEYHTALGQFLNYRLGIEVKEQDRILFLAMSIVAYKRLENLPLIMESIKRYGVKLLIFDIHKKIIVKWIK